MSTDTTTLVPASPALPLAAVPQVTITQVGAVFEQGPQIEAAEHVIKEAAQAITICQFSMADALVHIHDNGGGAGMKHYSNVTGIPHGDLLRIASVGRRVPISRRSNKLGFEHHRTVAALPGQLQQDWLFDAAEQGLSTKELKRSVCAGRVLREGEKTEGESEGFDGAQNNAIPHANRLSALIRQWSEDGTLDEMDGEHLYALHRDLLPVMKAVATVHKMIARKGLPPERKAQYREDCRAGAG